MGFFSTFLLKIKNLFYENIPVKFDFSKRYMLSNDDINQHHRYLFDAVNKFYYYLKTAPNTKKLDKLNINLYNYIIFHFDYEHKLMLHYNFDKKYPKYLSSHIKAHNAFWVKMSEFNKTKDYESMLQFLSNWLYIHIDKVDREMNQLIVECEKEYRKSEINK